MDGKPRGWGTLARTTGRGARRIQFLLTAADIDLLGRMAGADGLAPTLRILIGRQLERLEGRMGVARRRAHGDLAHACRMRRGPRQVPASDPVRWSQWVRPEDEVALERLRVVAGLDWLGEAVRFAIRGEAYERGLVDGLDPATVGD